MPIKKGFNSEKAARKWERLTQLSEQSFATIASGEAEEKDFNDLVRVLSKQSSLAAQVFSQGISTIQASADDLAAILKLNAKQKGKELTKKEFTQIQKQSFIQVFKSEVDSLATAIGRELAKTQPQVAEALKEFDTLSAKFDKLAEELKEKFASTFQHARTISTRRRKSPSTTATKKEQYDDPEDFLNSRPNNLVASKWEKELQLELKKRSTPVISKWMNGIYSSVISKAQNVIKNTKDFYWAGLESYDKYDLEMEEAHLYNTRNRAQSYFARTNADLKASDPASYSEKLQEYLTQVMEKQKAYLYNLKRDEPRKYARLRKKYIKGNVKATIKYGFSTMSRLFKSLYSKFRATDTGSILKTVAEGVAAYAIYNSEIKPKILDPMYDRYATEFSNWTSSLMPDIDSWTKTGGEYITTQYNNISSSLTSALDSAKSKWDETYNKYFGQEDGKDKTWYQGVWDIIKDFFGLNFIISTATQVWNWLVKQVSGGFSDLLKAVGLSDLVPQVETWVKDIKKQKGPDTHVVGGDVSKDEAHSYGMPWKGVEARTSEAKYGNAKHLGLDIMYDKGTKLHAYVPGTVVKTGEDYVAGKYVYIKDSEGLVHKYLHLNKVSVHQGQSVNTSTVIGETGNTGSSSIPHLHYAIEKPDGTFLHADKYFEEKLRRAQTIANKGDLPPSSSPEVKQRETNSGENSTGEAKAQISNPSPSVATTTVTQNNAASPNSAGNVKTPTKAFEQSVTDNSSPTNENFNNATLNTTQNKFMNISRLFTIDASRNSSSLMFQNVSLT